MGAFDTTLGAVSVGYTLAWGLYGVMSMQTFSYFQKFPKDNIWLKLLVTGLWVLDTLQLVLIGCVLYYWLITNYANPAALVDSPWTFNIGILVTNLIVIIVELFLTYRVFIRKSMSNRNYFLSGIIVLLSFSYFGENPDLDGVVDLTCYLGFESAVQVRTFQLQKIALFFKFQWIASVGLACASAADLIIAVSLCYYLLKSRTGLQKTDTIVNRLILYAMNTGLLTSIVVLMDMICFLTMPDNLVHISFNIVVGKLYTNSLLASLNFRDTVRSQQSDVVNTFSLGTMSNSRQGPQSFRFQTTANDDSFLTNTTNTVHDIRPIAVSHVIPGVGDEKYAV
ncbi:hypothetical protein DFH07DRAFT_967473 [Mycena maculata]|uniref:DUF6534 domain-containing protein n=1 Tax=Mycena maculata TaxID=230809 RepID=A0AAD7I4A7_9AGAR|nr:hypothetical protein DFH07DRAFT_967473 [Mycena maculata]